MSPVGVIRCNFGIGQMAVMLNHWQSPTSHQPCITIQLHTSHASCKASGRKSATDYLTSAHRSVANSHPCKWCNISFLRSQLVDQELGPLVGVKILHPTRHKIGHFRDVLHSQSLGSVLKKLNLTQQKHTYTNKLQHKTRMWTNAQRDGHPAEYRWRPLLNAAKFG